MNPKDEVLTPDEAAELLKVSKKTLLRHARGGQVPGTKLGRVWRFRRSELLALLTTPEAP
ncbi:MAG: helix-turn-helix domain-containing protein [bacterium]|nr:helix-turn-helix domain-containing protein [bacterium]